jgi:tRNA (guanine-N7-)-methyltransferase
MARLRKAGRVWRKPEARAAAERVMACADAAVFAIDPASLFQRSAPLEVELGAGRGEFIVKHAARFPERNFLAVESAAAVARLMAVRAGRSELVNLRVVQMDGRTLVNLMLPDRSVSAYHIYFPDPWPKERHAKHRLFTPYLVASLRRTLVPGAPVFIATDVAGYAEAIFPMMQAGGFARAAIAVPGEHETGFAHKFIAQRKAIYAAAFVPRD